MRERDQYPRQLLDASAATFRRFSVALLVAVGCATWAGSASAGIYRGGFDPVAPALEGFVDISLPNSCLSSATGFDFLSAGTGVGDCGQVDVLDATVNSPSAITFGLTSNVVTGLWWHSGTLEAITTSSLINPSTLVGPSTTPTGYFLSFGATLSGDVLTTSVKLYQQVCSCSYDYWDEEGDGGPVCALQQVGDPANQLGFVRVPEPGSLALVLGALAIGGLVLRRRAAI